MRRSECVAGAITLPLVVAVAVLLDAAIGFAIGLAVFPALIRGAERAAARPHSAMLRRRPRATAA